MVRTPLTDSSPTRRGRRPSFDRSEAIDIALNLFRQHGYEGVGIAELTEAIGIAAPSLYNAFGSKADLYRETLRRYAAQGLSSEDVERAPTALAAARALLLGGVDAVTSPGKPAGCMISCGLLATSADTAEVAAEPRALREATRVALRHRIARDIDAGLLLGATDPDALSRFIMAVLQGIAVQSTDGASRSELKAAAERALTAWPKTSPRVRNAPRR